MIPSPRKPSFAMPGLYDAAVLCDNCDPMMPQVLVTKRIYQEAIDYLSQYAEVDYENNDDGMPASELAARLKGKQAIVSQVTDKFPPQVIETLDGVRALCNVAVGFDNIDVPAATRKGLLIC